MATVVNLSYDYGKRNFFCLVHKKDLSIVRASVVTSSVHVNILVRIKQHVLACMLYITCMHVCFAL